jgi:hypothetical protein
VESICNGVACAYMYRASVCGCLECLEIDLAFLHKTCSVYVLNTLYELHVVRVRYVVVVASDLAVGYSCQ